MKETKRKMSKQTIFTIGMIMVSLLVITVASYAWYLVSNTAKITTAEFTADTLGSLMIANENAAKTGPDTYKSSIGLYDGVSDADKAKMKLSPCTTTDGETFYKPIYSEGAITGFHQFDTSDADEKEELLTGYIYEKVFYLKAGDVVTAGNEKYYDISLAGMSSDDITSFTTNAAAYVPSTTYGTFMNDNTAGAVNGKAANSLRISFVIEDSETDKTVVYEPNADQSNTADGSNSLTYTNQTGETYGTYGSALVLKQKSTKSFAYPTGTESGTNDKSNVMCTIKEGTDVKVTLRVWIEGMDSDCTNEIATDKIAGQIQFVSTENTTYTP